MVQELVWLAVNIIHESCQPGLSFSIFESVQCLQCSNMEIPLILNTQAILLCICFDAIHKLWVGDSVGFKVHAEPEHPSWICMSWRASPLVAWAQISHKPESLGWWHLRGGCKASCIDHTWSQIYHMYMWRNTKEWVIHYFCNTSSWNLH